MTQRGYAETMTALKRVNETLAQQVSERTAELRAELTERKRAEEHVPKAVQPPRGMRAIDSATTASLDLRVAFNVFLDQVAQQLEVDATDILLFDVHTQTLDYVGGRGFLTAALQHTHLRLGEGPCRASCPRAPRDWHSELACCPGWLNSRNDAA